MIQYTRLPGKESVIIKWKEMFESEKVGTYLKNQ
jgi:hypothetical protein